MKKVSIIIPCFNEEEVIESLFQRLNDVVGVLDYEFDFICVDDGSSDSTWKKINHFAQQDSRWKGVSFSRNFGHQMAVSAGMSRAQGDCLCVIDADLQDPPEVIAQFLEQWENGYEVVYGVRSTRQDGGAKKLYAWLFYRVLSKLSRVDIPADAGDFCLLDKKVYQVMNSMPERKRYLRGLRAWCGFQHKAVQFQREKRFAGEPCYTFKKSLKLAFDGIFSFSAVPLTAASHVGLWVSLTAFLGVVFTFLQRVFPVFFDRFGLAPAPGFATIVISILFLGGVQLICLGILGEYISRIYTEVQARPNWVVSETTNIAGDSSE